MDYLPEELLYYLYLHTDYLDLVILSKISKKFRNVYTNPQFWEDKAVYEFSLTREYVKEIGIETGSTKEAYIRLAAEHGVPFPGAERYGDIVVLSRNAALTNNFNLVEYFYKLSQNYDILYILAEFNKLEILEKLLPHSLSFDIESGIISGALKGNHPELVKTFLSKETVTEITLSDAVRSGNRELVKLLINTYHPDIDTIGISALDLEELGLDELLSIAVENDYQDIIDYLMGLGVKNFSWAMGAAAKIGDLDKLNYFLSLSDRNIYWSVVLEGAVQSGNKEIIDFVMSQGPTDLDDAMKAAAAGNYPHIVDYLVSLGAKVTRGTLTYPMVNDNVAMFSHLLQYFPLTDKDVQFVVKRAIRRKSIKILRKILKTYSPKLSTNFPNTSTTPNIEFLMTEYLVKQRERKLIEAQKKRQLRRRQKVSEI